MANGKISVHFFLLFLIGIKDLLLNISDKSNCLLNRSKKCDDYLSLSLHKCLLLNTATYCVCANDISFPFTFLEDEMKHMRMITSLHTKNARAKCVFFLLIHHYYYCYYFSIYNHPVTNCFGVLRIATVSL